MKPTRAALLILTTAATLAAEPAGSPPVLTATAEWNSNLSNSDRSSDEIGALELRAGLEGSLWRFPLGHDDTLVIGAGGSADVCPRFDDFNQLALGPRLAWRHKFGLGAFAPVLSLELEGDGVAANDSDRSGFAGRARLAWRQRLDEATQFSASYERSRRDAHAAVYDVTGGEAALAVTRDLDESWQLAVAGRWREGDVVSYATPPRPDLVALATTRLLVNTFGAPRVAYSIPGHTLGGNIHFVRQLDDHSSLTLGYEYRVTTHDPLRYVNQLVSATYTRQF